jgi:hypothetical protein
MFVGSTITTDSTIFPIKLPQFYHSHRFAENTNQAFVNNDFANLFLFLPKPDIAIKTKDFRKTVSELFVKNQYKQVDRSCFFIKNNIGIIFQTGNKMNAATDLLYLQNEYVLQNIYGAIYCTPSKKWRDIWSEGVIEADNVIDLLNDCKAVITLPVTLFEF